MGKFQAAFHMYQCEGGGGLEEGRTNKNEHRGGRGRKNRTF